MLRQGFMRRLFLAAANSSTILLASDGSMTLWTMRRENHVPHFKTFDTIVMVEERTRLRC